MADEKGQWLALNRAEAVTPGEPPVLPDKA
jgi:hypothetical protein